MTEVIVVPDDAEGGRIAAELLARRIDASDRFVLGVATGSTPLTTWAALAERHLDLSGLTAFALDEYLGLEPGHPQRFESVVDREITRVLGLDPRAVHVPIAGDDPDRAAAAYEERIRQAGGIDVQVLGIGGNGHLAFNEPGSSTTSITRVARLADETRRDNARFFDSLDAVPTHAITQGLATILRARTLLLLAFGPRKADALAAALEGPVTTAVPASIVQWHPDAIVIADEAAAARLSTNRVIRGASA